ncbi:solute carrier family 22 member 6-A-like, partial [Mizuhopecten yessoensis]|uniref:solute carrier family 22 member 6-A-like n=1 Tax=Mizuhopecten yessoensis TaxID=6573 RepID=UPI000B45B9E0
MASRNGQVELDDVWRRLGTFGRYQLVQAALLMTTVIPEGIQLLVVVFIGFRPPYHCANVSSSQIIADTAKYSNTSTDLSYHECHVDFIISDTNTTLLSLSPCPAGYNYGLEKDRTFVTEYDLVCDGAELAELSQTLLMVGQMVGAAILPQCSDRFGRKPILVSSHIGLLVAGLGCCFIPTFTGFAIMRFLIGAFQQGLAMTRPAMMLELFPKEVRYLTEVAALFAWTTSAVVMTPIVYFLRDLSWRYLYLVLTLTSAYSVLGYWIYDESVRWLLTNGKTAKAMTILKKAARMNNVDEEKIMMIVDWASAVKLNTEEKVDIGVESEMKTETIFRNDDRYTSRNVLPKYTIITLFKRRRIAMITLIMIFAWTVDSLTFYGLILSSASLPVDRYLSFFLLAVAEYPVVVFEYTLMNRLGRKWFCIIFHAVAALSLI